MIILHIYLYYTYMHIKQILFFSNLHVFLCYSMLCYDSYECDDEVGLFRCANGTIINSAYLNDGDCDCGDSCDDES